MDITNLMNYSKGNYKNAFGGEKVQSFSQGVNVGNSAFSTLLSQKEEIGNESAKKSENESKTNMLRNEDGESSQYAYFANAFGEISYNGVTYQYDSKRDTLCLGDMTKEEEVLPISLSDGTTLKVNLNNVDGLAKSIGMFKPEDVKRILFALSTHAKVKKKAVEEQLLKIKEEFAHFPDNKRS